MSWLVWWVLWHILKQNAGDAHGIMVIIVGNRHGDTSSNPGHSTNTLRKGMNPIILPPAMGK